MGFLHHLLKAQYRKFQLQISELFHRKQEERVQQVRKKLEEALMADILSRATDSPDLDEAEMDGEEA